MRYSSCPLSDIAEIFSGFAFRSQDLGDSGIPVIKIANIKNKSVTKECSDYFPESLLSKKMDRYYLQDRDCLVAMTGAGSVGKFGKMYGGQGRNYLINQRVGIIRPDLSRSDPGFVFYVLSNDIYEKTLYSLGLGAGQPNVSAREIGSLKIPYPPLPTQRKIASILLAYDGLIENNLRRIKILEEMAQNLYREWFVKFRFPGHQHARFTDSPLGRIPEGWEVVPFTEIANVLSGGTPKTNVLEYWGGSIPFFGPRDAPESFYVTNTEKSITEIGLRKCNSNLYPKDTVFITARGTVGKVAMPSMDMAMNQSCYALRGRQGISQLYLFLATKEQVDYLKKNTGGATFDTIVVDTFERMLVVKPSNEVIVRFSQLIQPGMELILNILKKNITLRRTRDLLLPRLISGEVDVSELDIAVPEEAKA